VEKNLEQNLVFKTVVILILLILLYILSTYSYLAFHKLSEVFSVIVAFGLFMIAWNSNEFNKNNYFLFIGIAYLFIGSLDLIHTIAYKGMNTIKLLLIFDE